MIGLLVELEKNLPDTTGIVKGLAIDQKRAQSAIQGPYGVSNALSLVRFNAILLSSWRRHPGALESRQSAASHADNHAPPRTRFHRAVPATRRALRRWRFLGGRMSSRSSMKEVFQSGGNISRKSSVLYTFCRSQWTVSMVDGH